MKWKKKSRAEWIANDNAHNECKCDEKNEDISEKLIESNTHTEQHTTNMVFQLGEELIEKMLRKT